jgi:hypothetical protein
MGGLDGDRKVGEFRADLRDDGRQILPQVPARAQEHRHHPQVAHAVGVERSRARRQRGLHQFQEGEHDALAGHALAEFGYELLERARPIRTARAVGEEDDCSFGHAVIICDAAASR